MLAAPVAPTMSSKPIAFVFCPHTPNLARLDTMPMALNLVRKLAQAGQQVDLFLWEEPADRYASLLPASVRVHYQREIKPGPLDRLRPLWEGLRFARPGRYALAFGLGQIGVHLAHMAAKASACPLVYVNDEFPSCWGLSAWTRCEQQAAAQAALVVVPDAARFPPLCAELPLAHKPWAALPNTTDTSATPEPGTTAGASPPDWRQRLGLPAGAHVFLHAGSVADWAQVPEILCSLVHWPADAVLLIHSRSKAGLAAYRRQMAHLDLPGRVFWSEEPLAEQELNSLVAFCSGSLALYRNMGPNIEYMGMSSGKLMRSIACGTPVIASDFASLAFVRENALGVQVRHPAEIAAAVAQTITMQATYRRNCQAYHQTMSSFESAWPAFCAQLRQSTGVALSG